MKPITEYSDGTEFLSVNRALLDTNPYLSSFFILDAPLLTHTDPAHYAVRCQVGAHTLLALKVAPYDLLLFGDPACVPELFSHLAAREFDFSNILCATEVGDCLTEFLSRHCGFRYEEGLAMDFMEARRVTEPSDPLVTSAAPEDLDEICVCLERFTEDCGLLDQPDRAQTLASISDFRVLRVGGTIAAMAKVTPCTAHAEKIAYVYTKNEHRGNGYARRVVNTLKNEILASGRIATLNVDRHNPVTNHLYTSLGFSRVFSQGEYRRIR